MNVVVTKGDLTVRLENVPSTQRLKEIIEIIDNRQSYNPIRWGGVENMPIYTKNPLTTSQ